MLDAGACGEAQAVLGRVHAQDSLRKLTLNVCSSFKVMLAAPGLQLGHLRKLNLHIEFVAARLSGTSLSSNMLPSTA